ncbi:ABC transporter permease [Adhaeribacter radiodurans]|uniref:ABC transporter permease n=1 Tax=Adhaeribacter radiodurans TaxID=2745197 RepID=A0A7L7L8X1_9BACT|nr:ABC transporter permease [Adhaeribacter radiodurans]QMU29282.1 ABC transporter permease [Adhaeribacter radiodurans]
MSQLLITELRKLFPYRTFWTILLLFTGLLLLFVYLGSKVELNGQAAGPTLYSFPDIWLKLTYIASYFNLLLGILIIIIITDEYSFRTFRQQVIDGWFKHDVILAKLLVIILIAAFGTVVLLGTGLFFGYSYSPSTASAKVIQDIRHLAFYFVQAVGYMTLAMLFAFLIRKNGLAIITFLIYAKIIEPIIHSRFPDEVDQYFPMKVLSSLTPTPGRDVLESITGPTLALTPTAALLPAIGYIGLFSVLSYFIIKYRDL